MVSASDVPSRAAIRYSTSSSAEPAVVKLPVVHDDFDPISTVLDSVSGGWPVILSNLRIQLETGETLPV